MCFLYLFDEFSITTITENYFNLNTKYFFFFESRNKIADGIQILIKLVPSKTCWAAKWLWLRGQTLHSVHCKRIPQQAKIRFVADQQVWYFSLIFFAVLDSTNIYLKHCTAQNRFKNRLWNPQTINKTLV